MWNLKKIKQTSEYNKNRLTDTENTVVVTSGKREGGDGHDRSRGLRGTNCYA